MLRFIYYYAECWYVDCSCAEFRSARLLALQANITWAEVTESDTLAYCGTN